MNAHRPSRRAAEPAAEPPLATIETLTGLVTTLQARVDHLERRLGGSTEYRRGAEKDLATRMEDLLAEYRKNNGDSNKVVPNEGGAVLEKEKEDGMEEEATSMGEDAKTINNGHKLLENEREAVLGKEEEEEVPLEKTNTRCCQQNAVLEKVFAKRPRWEKPIPGQYRGEFKHGNNDYRRVPPTWKFPKLALPAMHAYWHCGDEANGIPPMKFLDRDDVQHLGKRARTTYTEIKRVMNVVDQRAETKGFTKKDCMSHAEAHALYAHGEDALLEVVSGVTDTGRKRNVSRLTYRSVVKAIDALHKKMKTEPK